MSKFEEVNKTLLNIHNGITERNDTIEDIINGNVFEYDTWYMVTEVDMENYYLNVGDSFKIEYDNRSQYGIFGRYLLWTYKEYKTRPSPYYFKTEEELLSKLKGLSFKLDKEHALKWIDSYLKDIEELKLKYHIGEEECILQVRC
jgi:hypothetical protein